jgi:hypothetical protein
MSAFQRSRKKLRRRFFYILPANLSSNKKSYKGQSIDPLESVSVKNLLSVQSTTPMKVSTKKISKKIYDKIR